MNAKRKRIIVYGLVTRYGPQSVASATWLTSRREFLVPKLQYSLSFKYI